MLIISQWRYSLHPTSSSGKGGTHFVTDNKFQILAINCAIIERKFVAVAHLVMELLFLTERVSAYTAALTSHAT